MTREGDLRRAEERFQLVVESSPAAIVMVDAAGKIVLVNQQTESWFGYDRRDLIGQPIEILVPQRFHDRHRIDRDRFLAAPQARPMKAGHDLFARRKDGSEFPVDVSLHPMDTEEGPLVMAHIVDLTDRKQAAEEARLRQSMERLALLGQLAGGMAHEIRNPLGVIRNAAYYLQMIEASLDEDARESIAEIQQEVSRANQIVGDLLDYAREAPQRREIFDLAGRIRQLVEKQRSASGVRLSLYGAPDPIPVSGDAHQVDQIVMNLFRNGVQASEQNGIINVSVRSASGVAVVDVSDEGVGIADADRTRIFEPLFTTKATGIGLGLAVSRRYAERNGGSLELVERPGPGATFRLTLPLADGP
ncbi:MAG: nitrogen regulation protein NR(II) [Planctomycetaceae bacterium]